MKKQALSIDSQIKEMLETAVRDNVQVTEIRKESHSAKDSGQRPVFNKLISDIKKDVFNGILCWAPDRLSRNAGDLGAIVDLMDQGKIIEIRTHGQKFTNSPNEKFLLILRQICRSPAQKMSWLPEWEDFISLKWFNEVKYPEYLQNEVNYFINLPEMQKKLSPARIS